MKLASMSVAMMIRPAMMMTKLDISFLCPERTEACEVLAAMGGRRGIGLGK
jgi:hypothetical protein